MSTVSSITQTNLNQNTSQAVSSSQQSSQNSSSSTTSSAASISSSTTNSTKSKKYSAFDINNIYKGKSLENPKTSVIVPKHGLQTVGKVGAGRRVPPSANICGLKSITQLTSNQSQTSTNNTSNNNSSGGQGWVGSLSKEDESSSSSSSVKDLKDSNSLDLQYSQTQQPCANTTITSPDQLPPTDLYSCHSLPESTVSSNTNRLNQSNNQFSKEFPPISNAIDTQTGNNKSTKDVNYTGGGSRRESMDLATTVTKQPLLPHPKIKDVKSSQQPQSGYPSTGNYVHLDGECEKEKEYYLEQKNRTNNNNNVNKNSHPSYNYNNAHNNSSFPSSSSSNSLLGTAPPPTTAPIAAAQTTVNTNELFNLPSSGDFHQTKTLDKTNESNRNRQPYNSSSAVSYSSSNSSGHHVRKIKQEKRFAIDKPAIIDDQELKSLDQILKTDLECDWALEQEIDYTAKLEFSDNDSDEEEMKQFIKDQQTLSSHHTSKQSLKESSLAKDTLNDDSQRSNEDNNNKYNLSMREPPPNRSMDSYHNRHMDLHGSNYRVPPPPNTNMDPHNRYYGRKSDPLYEPTNRNKDNEYYEKGTRRAEYHVSSRSQQLSRSGACGYSNPQQTFLMQQQHQPSSNYNSAGSLRNQLNGGNGGGTILNRRPDEDWRTKRLKDDQTKMRGKMSRDDDEMMNRNSIRDYPPERRPGGGTSSNIVQGSGGLMYSKSQNYPPPNLPPRLQKQVEMLLNNKNYNENQRGPGGGGGSGSGRRSPTQQSTIDSQINGQMLSNHRIESRDYRDNDRHRRTPPEYDNSGRNRYKSTSETNWRSNKSIIQPQQSISNQDCEQHRRNSSELSTPSASYDQSKPKYSSETNNNIQQLKNDSNDSLNRIDNENDNNNSITNSNNSMPISSENKAQFLENNNKEANDPEKSTDVCDQSKLVETVENQEQQPVVTQSSTSTSLSTQSSATVASNISDNTDGINLELCNKNFEETNHRHNIHRNNSRSYGSQNMDTKRMPRYDGSSNPSERSRHSQPQRKYSNNSIDRFTPPSSCSSNPSPPIVIQRRDNYRTNSGGASLSNFQSIKSNDHHPHSQQSMATIQQASNNNSNTNNNNRTRTDSHESTPTLIVSSQSPGPVSLPAPITSSLPQQSIQSATSNTTSATLYPPAPGCSTIRAHTTYGPPPTKLFCDVSSTTSSQSPPIMPQQLNSSITGNNVSSSRSLITQQSQVNVNANKNSEQKPQQQQHSGGNARKLRGDRNENRNRNNSERSGNLRAARNVGKNQRLSPQAQKTMPKSASSNVPQTSVNTNNIQHDQQSQDLNIDEWETASESSDLMERSSGNRKSNENKASSSNSGTILPNSSLTNSTSAPSQTAKNYSTSPAATHSNDSSRTVYQSKSSQQQHNNNRHDNRSNRVNDLYYPHSSSSSHSRHNHDSNLFHHSYRGMSRGGSSGHGSATGRSFRGTQNANSTKRGSHYYQTTSGGRHTELSNQMSKLSLDQHHQDMKIPADDKVRNRKNSSSNQNLKRDDSNLIEHNEDNDGKSKANTANNRLSSNASSNSIKSKRTKEKSKSKSNQNRNNRLEREHNLSSQHNKDSITRTELISKAGNADVKQSVGNVKSKSNFDPSSQDSNIESSDHSKAHQQPKLPLCNEQQNSGTKCLTNQSNNTTMNSSNNVESTPTVSNKQKLVGKTKSETPLNISKIPDMDTSTNIINNRKILGTLIYENTKLKEENKVLSKIDEVHNSSSPVSSSVAASSTVSTNAKAGFGISTSSSTVNEELMKIASVKKVWDSPNEPHQSSERKNSLLSGSSNLNTHSPTEKNFDKTNKSLSNNTTAGQQKKSSPNMFCIPGSTPFVQNVTSPTVVEMNRSSYVSGTANFQNPGVIQTPTSPPTLSQMYTNPLAAAQGPQPNLTFQPYGSHQITPDQLNFGTGLGAPQQTTMFPTPHPAAAFMQQSTTAHAAAVAQQNPFNPMAMMVNTVQQQQQNLIMQFQSVNDQFNKFPLTTGNPNVLAAQNNLIKPFVQSGGQMNNLQQTTPTGGWPVGAGNFYTQLAPAPPPSAHFVQNPAVQTSATGGSQAVATSAAFTNRQQATNLQRGQMVDNGSGNQIRSFIGPSGSHITTLNDMHQHNMSSHQMQNNSHFINDQAATGAGNRGNQPTQTHNISHHVSHHRNQFSNSTNQTGNMNPAAAANWASNQQMFLKMPNGVGRQFPIQLINQPMLANANPAALAVAAQLNSRTSPLNAHALMTNSNNYSNPIQRPGTMVPVQQSKSGNLGMSSGQSNRNGGSSSGKLFSNQIGGKPSRQFSNSNRNSTTPSPGQNNNPSSATVASSIDSSVSNPGNATGLTSAVNKDQG